MRKRERRSLLTYHECRLLYGLEEAFVFFSFERGSRRGRLVVRASALAELCRVGVPNVPGAFPVGAPFVLGELLNGGFAQSTAPYVLTGRQINTMFSNGEWAFRSYRVYAFTQQSMRFEAGPRATYGTMTTFYPVEHLMAFANEGLHATKRSLSSRR